MLECMRDRDADRDQAQANYSRSKIAQSVLDLTSLEYMTDAQLQAHADTVASEIEKRQGKRR